MHRLMVVEHESQHGFDETVERLRQAVEKTEVWVFSIQERPFYSAMEKHGKPFIVFVKNYFRMRLFFEPHSEYL